MDKLQGALGGCLLGLWLALTALAFWYMEYRQLGHYQALPATDPYLAAELEAALPALAAGMGPRLVHFYDASCACEPASRRHIHELQARYPDLDVYDIELDALLPDSPWPRPLSLPTAALFSANGQLLYFGPYSSGPTCGTGINFVDNLLADLAPALEAAPWINTLAFGCFCDEASPDPLFASR